MKPAQTLHLREGQLYTTLYGLPEDLAAVLTTHNTELLAEVCKRFNAHEQLVALLLGYVEDDENNGMEGTDMYEESVLLLTQLGALPEGLQGGHKCALCGCRELSMSVSQLVDVEFSEDGEFHVTDGQRGDMEFDENTDAICCTCGHCAPLKDMK